MLVKEFLSAYDESSGQVSDLSRNLAFAGIAVVWVLRVGTDSGGIAISEDLILPLYCFVAALIVDFAQYIYKTLLWGGMNWYFWNKHQDMEYSVEVSGWVNAPTHILFWGKITLVGFGFIVLLCYLNQYLS